MRISNSFSEGEIQVMKFITQTLLRGGDPRVAVRHKEFGSLCRKVNSMEAKVNEQKARPTREESSVGTVGAPEVDAAPAAEAHDDLATAV
ncbi:MAG TPA: hypothetical protein VJR89_16395 [Polyangiales bacterium]|nr:hypothetical protein [Polyangiales bacterium]